MSPDQRMMKILTADPATLEKVDAVLAGTATERPPEPGDRRLLTLTQAADVLGCSRMTIFRMVRDGRLPAVEIRQGRQRIPSAALTALVEGGAG